MHISHSYNLGYHTYFKLLSFSICRYHVVKMVSAQFISPVIRGPWLTLRYNISDRKATWRRLLVTTRVFTFQGPGMYSRLMMHELQKTADGEITHPTLLKTIGNHNPFCEQTE